MNPLELIRIGEGAGELLRDILKQIPDDKQRALRAYFELEDKYKEEITRLDSDFDTMLAYRERLNSLREGFINALRDN